MELLWIDVRELIRLRVQRVVDRPAQLVADDEVDDEGRRHDCKRNGGSGNQRETGAKAHGSRRAYPTPRTVWIRRGLPPSSVLRRRYPM